MLVLRSIFSIAQSLLGTTLISSFLLGGISPSDKIDQQTKIELPVYVKPVSYQSNFHITPKKDKELKTYFVLKPNTIHVGHGGTFPPKFISKPIVTFNGGSGGTLSETETNNTAEPQPPVINTPPSNTNISLPADISDPPPPGEDPVNWGPGNPDWDNSKVVP